MSEKSKLNRNSQMKFAESISSRTEGRFVWNAETLFFPCCLVQVFTLKRSWNKILNRTPLQDCDEKTHIESFSEDLDQFGFNAAFIPTIN